MNRKSLRVLAVMLLLSFVLILIFMPDAPASAYYSDIDSPPVIATASSLTDLI